MMTKFTKVILVLVFIALGLVFGGDLLARMTAEVELVDPDLLTPKTLINLFLYAVLGLTLVMVIGSFKNHKLLEYTPLVKRTIKNLQDAIPMLKQGKINEVLSVIKFVANGVDHYKLEAEKYGGILTQAETQKKRMNLAKKYVMEFIGAVELDRLSPKAEQALEDMISVMVNGTDLARDLMKGLEKKNEG